jgi:RimJ/RimL family protein N-acetyltransferase
MRSFETARLVLSPLSLADAPAIQRHFPKWEIVRWMDAAIPWPYPEDGARTYLSNIALPSMESGSAWHWGIRPKALASELIGVISLMDKQDDNRGFWLALDWQGQGLMTEASDIITDFWFGELGRAVLRAPKAAQNLPSRRISEKCGMRVVARFNKALVSGERPSELWEISASEWRNYRAAASASPPTG